MKRFVIMAGGTGGHVMPALAVANQLRAKGMQISWIGTQHGIEKRLVEAAKIDIDYINIAGFRRTGWARQLAMPFMLIKAIWQSVGILKQRQADVVLGFGGFAAGPGGLAAILLRVPLVLHEQNSIAGATNKYLAWAAKVVLTGFSHVEGLKNYRWVGNPVRDDIAALAKTQMEFTNRTPLKILIVGGSQGARAFNQHLPAQFKKLNASEFQIWHQTGLRQYDEVCAEYGDTAHVQVTQFIDDMAAAYAWADVVICRAGAMTVAEICVAGKVAIFVPYAYAVSDHQRKNANYLVSQNAALMVSEKDLEQTNWAQKLQQLAEDANLRQNICQSALALAKPNATTDVVAHCMEVAHA